jgi:ADP-ribose pyrophosphatase YjhB (NUDIX family)
MDPPAPFGPGATRKATVRVGVGVLVVSKRRSPDGVESGNDDDAADAMAAVRVYAGRRIGPAHGATKLALPGGHLELYETWDQCARREVYEEMGLTLVRTEFLHVTNDIMEPEGKHYVTIFMVGYVSLKSVRGGTCTSCPTWLGWSDKTRSLVRWNNCSWSNLPNCASWVVILRATIEQNCSTNWGSAMRVGELLQTILHLRGCFCINRHHYKSVTIVDLRSTTMSPRVLNNGRQWRWSWARWFRQKTGRTF